MLINLDFEKAFDSVDWDYMHKVLKAVGLGQDICRWIEVFYKNIKSTVIVNGQTSSWFPIERGCRQGDPVSPYIFVICAEILSIMIKEEKSIEGIQIGGKEHKISQFADDTQLMNTGDKKSFEKSIEILDRFGKTSGLFLNKEKTQIIWLGKQKGSEIRYMEHLKMVWNPKQFKILGIWFTQDLTDMEKINYEDKLIEVKALFKIWLKRIITPLGRIAVLKSLILSKLTYLWLMLPNPPDIFVKKLQDLCYWFVWNKKQDRISRKTVIKEIQDGGLNLPDINALITALKLTWIKRLRHTTHIWRDMLVFSYPIIENIEKYSPNYLCNVTQDNSFWKHVFMSYKQFYYKVKPENARELLAEPILYNEHIKIGNKLIKKQNWNTKNVFTLSDFFKANGDSLSHAEFRTKYNIEIDFLSYGGCILSIKGYIREQEFEDEIKDNIKADFHTAIKKIYSVDKGSKTYYRIIVNDNWEPNCCAKWTEKLNTQINWTNCF